MSRPRTDTIAAVATGQGHAALGIVRLSGPQAGAVLDAVVPGARATHRPRRVSVGLARHPETGDVLDEVICFYCPAPRTATGEDVAEIHGHGGAQVIGALLDAVIRAGASAARPGEFTYRGFLNSRLDLIQAEAVVGLIDARTAAAARVAVDHLQGGLGREMRRCRDVLVEVVAGIEAGLDFPDEDLPPDDLAEVARRVRDVSRGLGAALSTYAVGSRLREGAVVAIVGPPNAGKSSLLNRIAGEDRAIVDAAPGTTRDVLEARGEARGIPVQFLDTAGLRASPGEVEKRGMERALGAADRADLVLVVIDGVAPGAPEALEALSSVGESSSIVVVNKKDLKGWDSQAGSSLGDRERAGVSALTGEGVDALLGRIGARLGQSVDATSAAVLVTARQRDCVRRCAESCDRAVEMLRGGEGVELVAVELREACSSLDDLLGGRVSEAVLDALFSTFCLGK